MPAACVVRTSGHVAGPSGPGNAVAMWHIAFVAILVTTIGWLGPVNAQTNVSAHEKALEARVRSLERRLEEMEARLAGKAVTRQSAPVQTPAAQAAVAPPVAVPSQAETPTSPKVDATAAVASGVEPGATAGAPQETFVFRENSVTLKPRHFEVSTAADYIRANGLLQIDRAFTSATAVRLGLLDWLEVNAAFPAFTSTRTRGTGPFRTQSRQVAGLGDMLLQGNARLYEQTAGMPGVVLSAGVLFPTGPAPYNFSTYQPDPASRGYNPNPTDLKAGYLSRGAWGLLTNLQFYKTIDPLILFFGVGARYFFPQDVHGHTAQNGVIYNYNMGFSFAASEKSTIGVQILGSYEGKLTIDRHAVPQSTQEPVSIRLSLIQRVFPNTWVEPSLGAGLTQDAASLDLGLGVRYRF